jgi:hypothetical protein
MFDLDVLSSLAFKYCPTVRLAIPAPRVAVRSPEKLFKRLRSRTLRVEKHSSLPLQRQLTKLIESADLRSKCPKAELGINAPFSIQAKLYTAGLAG